MKFKAYLADSPKAIAEFVAVIILSICAFTWIVTYAPGLSGVDGYFHMRYAKMLWEGGIPDSFPHLAFTIYTKNFANDHFLFHLSQIPFTFGNLITGAKFYGVTFATLSILLFFVILKHHKIRYPVVWAIGLLISSAPFLVRICMARAPGISLCTLLIATYLVLADKDRWLVLVGAFYVWLYGGFPLVGMLACSVFAASLLSETKKPQTILYCGLGIVIGLVIHPYFPNNIIFLFKSYTQIEFADVVQAGSEDYPYASSTVVRNALLPWAMMFVTCAVYFTRPAKLTEHAQILFVFSTVLLCMYMNVRRFVEYWPVFALMFSAFALNPFLTHTNLKRLWENHLGKLAIMVAVLVLAGSGYDTYRHIAEYREADRNPESFKGAALFIKENSKTDEIVFTADWDDFPLLFHFNPTNRYVVGLDPHYLYYYDPNLYELWDDITKGKETQSVQKIRENFQASFIFSLKTEKNLLKALSRDPALEKPAYEDEWSVVYKIQ